MKFQYLKNVVTLKVDSDKCTGCGICLEVCPREVLMLSDKIVIINKDNCIECGACSKNCPFKAINVEVGVGCAAAVYSGLINKTAPSCDCSKGGCC